MAVGVMACVGCASMNPGVKAPRTELDFTTPGWDLSLNSSKDTALDGLNVEVAPDGALRVVLENFTATNSPAVIRETGKAQKLTIDALGNVVDKTGNVVGKVVEGVVTLYGP